MKKRVILIVMIFVSLLTFAENLKPYGWVNDYANILTDEQESLLNSKLTNFEKQTSIEFTYAIVTTLGKDDIDSYANKLFRQWGIGKTGTNNGLLVVIAPKEHKYRIETGYGLEPYLTDNICYRLTRANFPVSFKQNNYFVGINSFTDDVIKELGKMTWGDRIALQKQHELAEKIQVDKIKTTIINTIFILLLLGIGVFLTIFLYKYNKKVVALKKLKEEYLNKYKSEIDEINKTLLLNNFESVKPNDVEINLIMSAKDVNEAYYNYLHAQRSLLSTYELIKNWDLFNKALNDFNKSYNILIKKQKENGITVSSKPNFKFNSYTFNKDLGVIQKQTSLNNELSWDIEAYNTLISKNITGDNIDSLCSNEINRFINEFYKLDYEIVKKFNIDLKNEIDIFNDLEKTFVNLNRLKIQYEKYYEKISDLKSYVKTIEDKNREYKKILEYIRNAPNVVDEYSYKLNNYLKNNIVSDNTKTIITTFLVTLLAFRITCDIDDDMFPFKSKDELDNIFSETEKVIKLSETDIENERIRVYNIKKKEDDERRRKQRLKEEEEESERRRRSYSSSSYSSSYSSSSYDSGSSFSGFGGGDSGGGGSSGSW